MDRVEGDIIHLKHNQNTFIKTSFTTPLPSPLFLELQRTGKIRDPWTEVASFSGLSDKTVMMMIMKRNNDDDDKK